MMKRCPLILIAFNLLSRFALVGGYRSLFDYVPWMVTDMSLIRKPMAPSTAIPTKTILMLRE